jgi:hypothetical protein
MKKKVRVHAHWIGLIEVDTADIASIDANWLGGALGRRVNLRDGRWFATDSQEAQQLLALAAI